MKQIHKMVAKVICVCMAFVFMAGVNVKADEPVLHDENPYRLQEVTGVNSDGDVYVIGDKEAVFSAKKVMPVFNDNPDDPVKVVNFRRWADGTEVTDTTQYTEYLTGNSGYTYGRYGADAAYLGTYDGKVRFMLAGVVGEVDEKYVQIVNLADMAVFSLYRVDNNRLMHYVAQNMETAGWATQLDNGAAPSYLSSGKDYYSYDGHYFYTDYGVMLEDYKASVRTNSVNPSSPYFNYYQFLPLRSQSVYSGDELTTLINNKINNTYSEEKAATSKMLNQGTAFVNQQNAYGVNALISSALAANESAWGTSSICQQKNNLFGLNAVDSSPGESADTFASPEACIKDFADGWMSRGYLYPSDWRYFGGYLGNKAGGINVKYASDPYWGEKAANHAYALDKSGGSKDAETYTLGIKKDTYPTESLDNRYDVNVRAGSTTSSTALYKTGKSVGYSVLLRSTTGVNGFYHIQSDAVLASSGTITKDTGVYDFDSMTAYISSDYVKLANVGNDIVVSHKYGEPSFKWSDDYKSCSAVFKCTECADEQKVSCEITSNSTSSSCVDAGEVKYTATVIFKGKTYTDTKTVVNPDAGHKYGNAAFEWADDNLSCKASVTCEKCSDVKSVDCVVTTETTSATCTEKGQVIFTATATIDGSTYTDNKVEENAAAGHAYGDPFFTWATNYESCTATFVCERCEEEKTVSCTVNIKGDGTSCTETGETIYTASVSFNGKTYEDVRTIERAGSNHSYKKPVFAWANNLLSCYATFECEKCEDVQEIKCEVRKKTTDATCVEEGKVSYTASVTFEETTYTDVKETPIAATGHAYEKGSCVNCGSVQIIRIFGETRYETCFSVANAYKAQLGIDMFDAVIIANGKNFADALSGSYLSAVKYAPILMTDGKNVDDLYDYVEANMKSTGTIYILGGVNAVPQAVEDSFEDYDVVRLAGTDRYATNLKILEEAGIEEEAILIATGKGFADSLSASATKKPILLVNKSLTEDQKELLKNSSGKFYILGGTSVVSKNIEKEVAEYGTVERLGGANRYETSVLIAKKFFNNPEYAVLAYGKKFPDGLCGGPLAMSLDAPLILTATSSYSDATSYAAEYKINEGVVLGGTSLISDTAVRTIFGAASDCVIYKWK